MAHDDVEARLADLAAAVAFPPTPDLAAAVAARLRAPSGSIGARPRPLPIRRSVPRSLLLAAGLALLVIGGAFAVRFGLDLLSIEFGPVPSASPSPSAPAGPAAGPSPSAESPGPPGADLGLGSPLTLGQAREGAPFEILVPAALGPPDVVYLGGPTLRGQVAFVYASREDLPASRLLDGAGLLITQNRGEPDTGLARKLADAGLATVEQVDVDGSPGVWIAGQPHIFWYLAPDGFYIEESRRLVGDTLAWERGGVLYRIEGAITVVEALEIARSMR
jgi:hypothetical protein